MTQGTRTADAEPLRHGLDWQPGWPLEAVRAITGWSRRHPMSSDAALVAVLALLTGADALRQGSVPDIAWQVGLWVPVIFRRTAPVAVFATVGAVAAAQWVFGAPMGGDLAVLVVLYTVAAHRRPAVAVAAAAAVQVGVILAVARFGSDLWPRLLLLLTVLVIAAVSLGITQQARRAHLAALTDRAARLEREADQQAQLATAAERTRIAREMHDIVAHSLSVMIALADGATLTEDQAQARAAMGQVASTGREALADTRRVLGVLRTDADSADRAPLPGLAALDGLFTTVRATGLRTSLLVRGTVFPVPDTAQTAMYRIVQEALTNTVKHARNADRATVSISYQQPMVILDITDNGSRRTDAATPQNGRATHGLLGMQERAVLFAGTCTAGWDTSAGWRITATLNLADTGSAERRATRMSSIDVDLPAVRATTGYQR